MGADGVSRRTPRDDRRGPPPEVRAILTADADLASAAGDRAILVAAEGRRGADPELRDRPVMADWKGAAAYLAELRSAL